MLPQTVADHYRLQQRRTLATLVGVRRLWASMGQDFNASWDRISEALVLIVAAAQQGAAAESAAYIAPTLMSQGVRVEALAKVNPEAFVKAWPLAGDVTGDLGSLLYGSVIAAEKAQVDTLAARLAVGERWLSTTVQTQLADAGRQAAGATITATPGAGWVRMVNPPCCQRCAVLAGKFFRWNSGFSRHPRCDCRHSPATEKTHDHVRQADIGPDQIKDLTKAQRQAVEDGADLSKVINAHRAGTRSADGMTTTEGTTRRRYRGSRNAVATPPRLTPEAIYKVSATREEAISLLIKHGYLRAI